eukprot:187378_1
MKKLVSSSSISVTLMSTRKTKSLTSELLVNGFIREIEHTLNNKIIPTSINTICFRYYYVTKLLFCINGNPKNEIYISNIHSTDKNKFISSASIHHNIGSLFLSGTCLTTKFKYFPDNLSNIFNSNTTNVLFKCGGWSNGSSHAIFIDTNTFKIEELKLPILPRTWPYGNSISFSSQHQLLISVGGSWEHTVHGLYFNNNEKLQWINLKSTIQQRYNPTTVMIDKYNKLMICGGKDREINLNTAEIYNIDKDEWQQIESFNMNRRAAGMYWNEYKNDEIYLGGGIDNDENGNSVEYYDFHKNKWNLTSIPNTEFAHKLHPILWMDSNNNNILYIASICGKEQRKSSNSCECIDLRICDKWNSVIDEQLLKNVFGINEDSSTESFCLLAN